MKLLDTIHGFIVKDIKEIKDSEGTMYILEHKKSKAQLLWFYHQEEVKTFALAFKTTPFDNTGVFHILEHSVLNGSLKYPVKEPFTNLLKSSMQTYLNAMTYDDKTVYPVASRNAKDFMNLVKVYTDAVFNPEIYRNPNIFYQEGWHVEYQDGKFLYKGVVLNEMKGVYASGDTLIANKIQENLFKDNCYQFVSGGDPSCITDLTYEKFIETHQRYYHPSNCKMFVDGDVDIDTLLMFLDAEYLSKYDAIEPNTSIPYQTPLPSKIETIQYEPTTKDLQNKTIISFASIVSNVKDIKKNLAIGLFSKILTGTNESPLKKPFIDDGNCEDVDLTFNYYLNQPYLVLTFRNTASNAYEIIKEKLKKTIQDLASKGLDKEEFLAALARDEFFYRERKEPVGILNMEMVYLPWMNDADPSLYMDMHDTYQQLKQDVYNGYLEKLLLEVFGDESHVQVVIAEPSNTLSDEVENKENQKLLNSHYDITEVKQQMASLEKWQMTPDDPRDVAKLPHLSLKDIDPRPNDLPLVKNSYKHVDLLITPKEDSGVNYFYFFFNLAGLRKQQLPYVGLLCELLADLPTVRYSMRELSIAINKVIGSFTISPFTYSENYETDAAYPYIQVRFSCLKENTEKAIEIIHEILHDTIFHVEDVKNAIKQLRISYNESLTSNGLSYARSRIKAAYTATGVFEEYTEGVEFVKFLNDLDDHFDTKQEEIIDLLNVMKENFFISSRLTVGYSDEANTSFVERYIDEIEVGNANKAKVHYPKNEKVNEVFVIPGSVSYAARGNIFTRKDGGTYVLRHMLNYEHLWSEVRVKGGAYGASISCGDNQFACAGSYRDPDPNNALHAFTTMDAYAKDIPNALDDYIIGAVASVTPLLSPKTKIFVTLLRHFIGISYEDRYTMRKEMLEVNKDILLEDANALANSMKEGMICVFAPKNKIDDLKEFNVIVKDI